MQNEQASYEEYLSEMRERVELLEKLEWIKYLTNLILCSDFENK